MPPDRRLIRINALARTLTHCHFYRTPVESYLKQAHVRTDPLSASHCIKTRRALTLVNPAHIASRVVRACCTHARTPGPSPLHARTRRTRTHRWRVDGSSHQALTAGVSVALPCLTFAHDARVLPHAHARTRRTSYRQPHCVRTDPLLIRAPSRRKTLDGNDASSVIYAPWQPGSIRDGTRRTRTHA
jgi:hypothetical protein